MNPVDLLRAQVRIANAILEGTMADVTARQAHWTPPGIAHPIGAVYVHTIIGEDFQIHGVLKDEAPLAMEEWANKIGVSEPPPIGVAGDWSGWARNVQVDLSALRAYAQAVYAAADSHIASLTEQDLERTVDMSKVGMGNGALGWFLGNIVVGHVNNHCGEISALKGVQGAKGYPF